MTGDHVDEVVDVAKLGRMHGVVLNVLAELRQLQLDAASIRRLEVLTQQTLVEIGSAVPPDLLSELGRVLGSESAGDPTADELRIVEAQLLGWLRGMVQSDRLADLQAIVDTANAEVARLARSTAVAPAPLSTDGYL